MLILLSEKLFNGQDLRHFTNNLNFTHLAAHHTKNDPNFPPPKMHKYIKKNLQTIKMRLEKQEMLKFETVAVTDVFIQSRCKHADVLSTLFLPNISITGYWKKRD